MRVPLRWVSDRQRSADRGRARSTRWLMSGRPDSLALAAEIGADRV